MPDAIASHKTYLEEIVIFAAKIIKLMTGCAGLVGMAEKFMEAGF